MTAALHAPPFRLCVMGRAAVLLCMLAAIAVPVLAADCGVPVASAELGTERSQWEERNAQGQRLVREVGTLRHHRLAASLRCAGAEWALAWGLSQGERRYDGLTNTGSTVVTSTGVRTQDMLLSAWLPVQGAWSVGGRMGQAQTQRNLYSTATALGFPESFQHWHAGLGLRFQQPLGDDMLLTATGWLGAGPGGSVRVELPGYAPARLPLGSSRMVALGLELSSPLSLLPKGWRWSGGLHYRREVFSAGDAQVLLKAGQPVGTAWQPESLHRQLRWSVGLSHSFD